MGRHFMTPDIPAIRLYMATRWDDVVALGGSSALVTRLSPLLNKFAIPVC